MSKQELEWIVTRFCEARNIGQLHYAGPNGYSDRKAGHEGYPHMAIWECDRVHAALCKMGKGGNFPSKLVELLDHVYWHGRDVDSFNLVGPGRGLCVTIPELGGVQVEIQSFGFKPNVFLLSMLDRFFNALQKAVEEQPKPEAAKEYEAA